MIQSFADKETAAIFDGRAVRRLPPGIQQRAREKLKLLDAAKSLEDLQFPPANRLKLLQGRRKGQHSVRINDQWRICFIWQDGEAWEVEIVDYH